MSESEQVPQKPEILPIRSFDIRGLHGNRDFSIPVEGNRLILVGENGTGKSTVVTMLYQFLSRQWQSLARYPFSTVSVQIGNEELALTHDDIETYLEEHRHEMRRYPPSMRRMAMAEIDQLNLFDSPSQETLHSAAERVAMRAGMPIRAARRLIAEVVEAETPDTSPVTHVNRRLAELFDVSVLFLPTYRRIERDLAEIFPHLEQEREELMQNRRRHLKRTGKHSTAHTELVEFGMEDVESLINRTMLMLREELRQALDSLTGEYLRDVLRKTYKTVDTAPLRDLGSGTLESILGRIDERILPSRDKERLPQTIARISESKELKEEDAVVAHFLTKIIKLHSEQGEREQPVRSFSEVCNRYLQGKRVGFDNSDYSLKILSQGPETDADQEIELSVLSSGEKQIISLFAHLYLSTERQFFVVIDEPELSLSVPWQKNFLPDIANSGYCAGLVAVTHSPFIFENDLEDYTHSLSEFARTTD